jgi:hypothetical protein
VACGYGAICPDGVVRTPCEPFYTTKTETATAANECVITDCSPCSGANPQVYFTTGK